jgi:hypothetical protein
MDRYEIGGAPTARSAASPVIAGFLVVLTRRPYRRATPDEDPRFHHLDRAARACSFSHPGLTDADYTHTQLTRVRSAPATCAAPCPLRTAARLRHRAPARPSLSL